MLVVAAGMWALQPKSGQSVLTPPDGDDGPGDDDDIVVPGDDTNDTVTEIAKVPRPVDLDPAQASMTLGLDFEGRGEGHEYLWNEPYRFTLSIQADRGWHGTAVVKVFAERGGDIGPMCLIVRHGEDNSTVNWWLNEVQGTNIVSGDSLVWEADGAESRTEEHWVTFNRTGTFNMVFQVFDARTGEALSQAVGSGECMVPVAGELVFKALNRGEWRTVNNTTYFVVLLNVTNDWNVRHSVSSAYLVLSNNETSVGPSMNMTAFDEQSLATGQSTQFLVFFLIEGEPSEFELAYFEPGRPPVEISLD